MTPSAPHPRDAPSDSTSINSHAECELMERLQQTPELLLKIEQSQVAEFKLQQLLRAEYPADLVRAALSLVELRRKARDKFARASELWFDRQGLEQATPEVVADYKAAKFQREVGQTTEPIYDLCSGIGSDSLALARQGLQVVAVDAAAEQGKRLLLNAAVYGVQDRIQYQQARVQELDYSNRWVHLDPDRRTTHTRAVRLEDYEPPLEYLQQLTETARGGALKLSPASNFGGKFRDCEIELISLQGECKEATVWFGELAGETDWRATILPAGWTLAANTLEYLPQLGPLDAYLFDPDPAVVRAGLVDALADQLNLQRLDDAEEYLTGSCPVESPAVTSFRVLAELPHSIKEIARYFRQYPVGDVEIKCRHVPVEATQLRKKLPLSPEHRQQRGTLFIARIAGKTRAIVAERLKSD